MREGCVHGTLIEGEDIINREFPHLSREEVLFRLENPTTLFHLKDVSKLLHVDPVPLCRTYFSWSGFGLYRFRSIFGLFSVYLICHKNTCFVELNGG